jgi:hypothetical protein
MKDTQLTHLVYADDQVLLASVEDDLQRAITGLHYILKAYYIQILDKTRAMGMLEKYCRRFKIVVNNKIVE